MRKFPAEGDSSVAPKTTKCKQEMLAISGKKESVNKSGKQAALRMFPELTHKVLSFLLIYISVL